MQPYIYFSLEKVLNLIEKQSKEIEQLKIVYKLMEKEALRDGKEELEIKDKMIDLMSEQLAEIKIWDYKKDTDILKVKEEVKEQFRKKVENNE